MVIFKMPTTNMPKVDVVFDGTMREIDNAFFSGGNWYTHWLEPEIVKASKTSC